jgi:hypothetical protein
MKTVLQELISELKSIESYDSIVQGIIKRAESKLEKEKEQIMKAHKIGWEDCQEYIKTIGQTTRKGKKYYNQTYEKK